MTPETQNMFEHLPSAWTIIMFLGTIVWNTAILYSDIRQTRRLIKGLQAAGVAHEKEFVALKKSLETKENELTAKITAAVEWGRIQICERIEYNETHYVRKDVLSEIMKPLMLRLDKIDSMLDKIYRCGSGEK